MNTHRERLDREIGALPPSTIDIDALIVGQRRQVRLRKSGLGGLVMALVLAVGAVLVFLPRSGGMQWDRQVATSPSPPLDPRQAEAARLTAAWQQLVSQAFPGATLGKVPPTTLNERPGEPLVFVDLGTHFEAAAVVTDAQGTGTIKVSVGKEDSQFRNERACMTDPAPLDVRFSCEVVDAPGGEKIMRVTTEIGFEDFKRYLVEIIRADGNAVSIDVSNGVLENDQPYRGRRPQPLLTLDQATAMVQERSLGTTLP